MTRRHLHNRTSLTVLTEWGDPFNVRDSLQMALYWRARRWKFTAQRPHQPPLYDRSPRRLHAGIAVNDKRRVVNGPYLRWEADIEKVWAVELARIDAARQADEDALLRLYNMVTGQTPLPQETDSQ